MSRQNPLLPETRDSIAAVPGNGGWKGPPLPRTTLRAALKRR
jgi:hypothetical protein